MHLQKARRQTAHSPSPGLCWLQRWLRHPRGTSQVAIQLAGIPHPRCMWTSPWKWVTGAVPTRPFPSLVLLARQHFRKEPAQWRSLRRNTYRRPTHTRLLSTTASRLAAKCSRWTMPSAPMQNCSPLNGAQEGGKRWFLQQSPCEEVPQAAKE